MIRRAIELKKETINELRGGKGQVELIHILEKDELGGKGRLYARNILKPGASIGFHQHSGEFEAYYIISGEGTVNDNGILVPVKAGDLVRTDNGQSHSIENTGNTDLEFIALILFE